MGGEYHPLSSTLNLTAMYYRQCILRKYTTTGYMEQTSWIPEPYCKIGNILKLDNNNGWKVITAGMEAKTDEKQDCYYITLEND